MIGWLLFAADPLRSQPVVWDMHVHSVENVALDASMPAGAESADGSFDVVVRGGRVIDPESGLDAIRDVGIRDGTIAAVNTESLDGDVVLDASGLVVAPGFIDVVWQVPSAYDSVRLLDGVTTTLELWIGTADVDRWYREREGTALANFGVGVGHERVRRQVMDDPGLPGSPGDAMERAASDAELAEIRRRVEQALARGALAVSLTNVTPGASGWETLEVLRAAAAAGATVWAAPRETGDWERDDMPRYLAELIGAVAITGARLCIVHLQASGGPHTPRLLRMVEEARTQGLEVAAEVFPYSSNLSNIQFLDVDDWPDAWFDDLEWLATGERLTRESYGRFRGLGGVVVVHNGHLESEVAEAVASPLTMVSSGAYLDADGHGHPRSAGTHARVLGDYVREQSALSLEDAIRKMTSMPARLLERRTPAMARKGRIQVGADADLVVFDAGRIVDRATFREPALPSAGVRHVLVHGTIAVRDGAVLDGVRAGRPIRAPLADGSGASNETDSRTELRLPEG